jgi:hypothetical protein
VLVQPVDTKQTDIAEMNLVKDRRLGSKTLARHESPAHLPKDLSKSRPAANKKATNSKEVR